MDRFTSLHLQKPVVRLSNRWIRTSSQCDAVLDFDEAARNPAKTEELDAAFDSGDHLHLSSNGYLKLASIIDLKLFKQ